MKWQHYVIAFLVMVLVSTGITMGYHCLYVGPADEILVENIKDNTADVQALANKQDANQQQISHALEFIVAIQGLMNQGNINYRANVGKAFGEVIVNFESAQVRLKTLERRHLEVIRALAVLQKKHWDPAKAAEASGFD